MNCKKCGNLLSNDTFFCPMCGASKSETNNNSPKKDNKKIILFVIIGILLVILGIYIFQSLSRQDELSENNNNQIDTNDTTTDDEENILQDENTDENTTEEYTFNLFIPSQIEKKANNDNELTKNIVIEEIFFNPKNKSYGSTRDAYVYGKNNNSTMVEVKVIIEYYDSEGYRIERTTSSEKVAAGKEFVISLYIENDSLNYSKVKLSYEASKLKSYETEVDLSNIEYTHNLIKGKDILVIAKNISKETISRVSLAALYYKNNKVVFATNGYITMFDEFAPNTSAEVNFYGSKLNLDEEYNTTNKIEYDDYKIVLFAAYNTDSTNY